jgi:hypothetical protein
LRAETRRPHTCKAQVALIADYIADELGPAESETFEEHLDGCKDCVAFLRTYKNTIQITRTLIRRQPQRNDVFLPLIRR